MSHTLPLLELSISRQPLWLSRLRILWLFVRRGVYFTDTIGEN